MKLHFLGASGQVTGSRYVVESGSARIMIDCGLFQEREYLERNWRPCPVPAKDIETLLLTHAHIDHLGLVPKLVREGFRGRILCTPPTRDLAEVLLRDSAKIQMEDAQYKRRRHQREGRRGRFPEVPLYTLDDVERALPLLDTVSYGRPVDVAAGIQATWFDAGHILGSAMLRLVLTSETRTTSVLFSGDIGQWGKPLVRDPTTFQQADYVVMESTYGDRDHESGEDIEDHLARVITATVQRRGNVIIPTFAVERAQELMFFLSRLRRDGRMGEVPVFLDSPMAVDATEIFRRHRAYFDAEAWEMIQSGHSPMRFSGLRLVRDVDESKAINRLEEPAIIMAPAGMCNAGRIKHHLRHNIERPECTIIFVGYQAHGTLGRQILDGRPHVRIHGREYAVRAAVERIFGFSAHADRSGLLRWLSALDGTPRRVFLTHGEAEASAALAQTAAEQLGLDVHVPRYQEVVDLA
jgi:metallo-beta-lactamase family protein